MNRNRSGTWKLSYGIHSGTRKSRETISQGGFESKEACEARLKEREALYIPLGYVIWFAKAIDHECKVYKLRKSNTDYNR